MEASLAGKTALITGGNRGLGKAMALGLAAAGANVVIWGRDRAALSQAAEEVRAAGADCLAQAVDVTSSTEVEEAVAEAWTQTGGIDVLINSAGVVLVRSAVETSDEEWDDVLKTNLTGVFYCCRAVGARMLDARGGKVINVASNLGQHGVADWSAYTSSKGGLIVLSKSLAWEWAPKVTVNVIAPGAFYTDMNRHLLDVPETMEYLKSITPLARVGDPPEIGPLAVFMAGPGSDYMTGSVVNIDGGVVKI